MKIYATIGNDIKVTKDQFDEIIKKQNEGYTVTQALILMGLETVENVIDGLERNRKYAQYDIDKKIEEIKEFEKTLNKEEEVEDMDLNIKYRTGRATRKKIITGTSVRDKYEDVYEVNVVTNSGTMTLSEWKNAIEKRIVELKEEHIFKGLINYALEECAWINTKESAKEYALEIYARRLWENEDWVGCKDFRKKIGLDNKDEKEVNDMKFVNIESVEVNEKIINVGARCTIKNDKNVFVTAVVEELRKYDDKVVALTWDGELDVKGLFKIDEDIAKPVATTKEESKVEEVKENMVANTNNTVEIVSLNEIVKNDRIKVMNQIFNSGYTRNVNNFVLGMAVKDGVAIVLDKNNNNAPIITFEVIKKKKYSVTGDFKLMYTKEVDLDKVAEEVIEKVKSYGEVIKETIDKKEVARLVKDVMELSKDLSTVEDNLNIVDLLIEGAQLHTFKKVATIGVKLKNEKYIGRITKKDIDDDDIKTIGDCSEVYIEVVRDEENKTLTVGAYVEVDYIYTDGTKGRSGVTIKEIVEKLPKNTNDFSKNVV